MPLFYYTSTFTDFYYSSPNGRSMAKFAAGGETFICASPHNDADDCNPTVDKGIEKPSQSLDATKRMLLVHKVDKRL
jgi:hypothetical protein